MRISCVVQIRPSSCSESACASGSLGGERRRMSQVSGPHQHEADTGQPEEGFPPADQRQARRHEQREDDATQVGSRR